MSEKRLRRYWPDEEKRSICQQTAAPGVSVAQVARRYALNANLIFKWLRDERYAPVVDVASEDDVQVFLPIEVEADVALPSTSATIPTGRIKIELAGGHRITAEGGFDVDVLARLLKGLSS